MFYQNAEGKMADLNGGVFPQPPLVWKVSNGELSIRALSVNNRPQATTTLAAAPFWNLSDDGRVCTGTMRRPDSATVAVIPAWERGFYESAFTHANVGRITRHEGGFEGLWESLKGKRRRFPTETLIQLPQTLEQFVRGERAIMRIEHALSLHTDARRPVRVLVAGAGGTGSAITMGLPYLDQALRVWGRFAGLDVFFWMPTRFRNKLRAPAIFDL